MATTNDTTLAAAQTVPNSNAGIDAIARMAVKAAGAHFVEIETSVLEDKGLPAKLVAAVHPDGSVRHVRDLIDAYRLFPRRVKGTAQAQTSTSFCALVNRHKTAISAIFAETKMPDPSLTCVVNYFDSKSDPDYADHLLQYKFPLTQEFKAWLAQDGEMMTQAEFAAFLEDHAAELASPFAAEITEYEALFREQIATPSEIIALSRGLEINVNTNVKSATRLKSGEREAVFAESHTNGSGEKLLIPGVFMVSLIAFDEGAPVRIPARLRYRLREGRLAWAYQLYRADHWLQVEIRNVIDAVTRETSLPVFEGAPEK